MAGGPAAEKLALLPDLNSTTSRLEPRRVLDEEYFPVSFVPHAAMNSPAINRAAVTPDLLERIWRVIMNRDFRFAFRQSKCAPNRPCLLRLFSIIFRPFCPAKANVDS